MGAEDALHFGLIPRMHRGIFAMNELPDLDELVQVGLFNILEERDVQIRGYPIQFDLDVLILFSANPSTYNRSGKVIPQLKDRIGSVIHTHYPQRARDGHSRSWSREAGIDLGGDFPDRDPVLHAARSSSRCSVEAREVQVRRSASRASAPASASATYRTMIASARQRAPSHSARSPSVPHQRPRRTSYTSARRQAGARPDGEPSDVGAASARMSSSGPGDQGRLRGVRR